MKTSVKPTVYPALFSLWGIELLRFFRILTLQLFFFGQRDRSGIDIAYALTNQAKRSSLLLRPDAFAFASPLATARARPVTVHKRLTDDDVDDVDVS